MQNSENKIISQNMGSVKGLIQLILVALIFAAGINFISAAAIDLIGGPLLTAMGLILIFVSLPLLVNLVFKDAHKKTIESFFIYDPKKNKLVPVEEYSFSEHLEEYLNSALKEEKKIREIWKKYSLKQRQHASMNLIGEMAEYFFLTKLSLHLEDYFHLTDIKNAKVKKYFRRDIPKILSSNKFLELFSRPMKQRTSFIKDGDNALLDNNKVYAASSSTGALFEKFELILPKNARIERSSEKKLTVESDIIKLDIKTLFKGFASNVPFDFLEYYLLIKGDDRFKRYRIYQVEYEITIKFKSKGVISYSGLQFYKWIDSFLDYFEEEASQERFFNSINWKEISALLHCLKNVKKRRLK